MPPPPPTPLLLNISTCHLPPLHTIPQVLGRNLEAVVNKSMELMKKWEDQFVSVEHLVRGV